MMPDFSPSYIHFLILCIPSFTSGQAAPSISTPRFTSSEPIWTVDRCTSYPWYFCHQHWKRSDDPLLYPMSFLTFTKKSFWVCYPRCRSSHISPSFITKRQDPKILGPIFPEYLFTDPTGRRDTWSYVIVIGGYNFDDVATVPPEILKLRDERGTIIPTDCMLRSYLNSYGTKLLTFPSSHKFFWIWQRAFG